MKKEHLVYEAQYKANVAALVDDGGYKSLKEAERYCDHHLGALWRRIMAIDNDDRCLTDQLEFTPTMTLILHLFGKAVHRHGTARSKLPVLGSWLPVVDASGSLRFPCAVPKNDIAKIIGKSRSAVDEAISRFRSKQERYESLFEKRVALAMFVETGIMLDVMTHANLSFSFMREDYEYAGQVARMARINDSRTLNQQQQWCSEATSSLSNLDGISEAAQPANQTERGSASQVH